MHIIRLFLIVVFWQFVAILKAQPSICGNTPAMTSFCSNACIICDIDGFTGRNNSSVTGQAPPGFCTSKVHHMQWIGFIAGTANLTLEVHVTNCNRNQGLEIGLYESFDCNVFRRISDCDTDIQENEKRVFTNTVPLVVGQYYYFVMDGSDDDICDWTIRVLNGSTKVAPLDTAPEITIPDKICQNDTVKCTTKGLAGATFYNWTIEGKSKPGMTVNHTFANPGKYEICLDAFNVCDQAPQICKTVEVLPVPSSTVKQQICYGECFSLHGKSFCETGLFPITVTATNGCDSIINLDLIVDDRITASTSLYICEGDTLFLGDGKFATEGAHQAIIKNQEGCNVYMDVQLRLIVCNIQSQDFSIPVKCNGQNSGTVRFAIQKGTAPFTFTGFKIENPSITFEGNIANTGDMVSIPGVDEGNYSFTIHDTFGNSSILTVFVSQPPSLQLTAKTSDYNGFGVSCSESSDGFIHVIPAGGVPSYALSHSFTSSSADSIPNLPSGKYTTTVTDSNGCSKSTEVSITSPPPVNLKASFLDPDCSGPFSGNISVTLSTGGVPPYAFSLNGSLPQISSSFNGLTSGQYVLALQDANGCTSKQEGSLTAAIIPTIFIPEDTLYITLGDSAYLSAFISPTGQEIKWTPTNNLDCGDCSETHAQSVNDTEYTITATSVNGCITNASILVNVDKKRSFVISNVVTPDGNGQNDRIAYFAGNDVLKMEHYRLYDRWGNMVLYQTELPKGRQEIDWHSGSGKVDLVPGTYTWICTVSYIDGLVKTYSGSLTMIK